MTALTNLRPAGTDAARRPVATMPVPGLIALAATLLLAATTGLPMGSIDKLIPQADDTDGPFLGL